MTRSRPALPAILAVDGGNSKTDVAIVAVDGAVLGVARGPGSSHQGLGIDGSVDAIDSAIRSACAAAGVDPDGGPVAGLGVFCLAGADFPVDDRRLGRALRGRGWSTRTLVRNDTFAVLRAGTERGWGVAVVCGAGMNCAGVGPGGRIVRFPALGQISGDWVSGGEWMGIAALGAAVRARDGRGERTELERLVPAHFGLARPLAVVEAIHLGRLGEDRVMELPPIVFRAAAAGDGAAGDIIDRLADEIVALAVAAIRRLRVATRDAEVILGGGVVRSGNARLLGRIRDGVADAAPRAVVSLLRVPPVVGAALIGLDEIRARRGAADRVRAALTHERIGTARRMLRPMKRPLKRPGSPERRGGSPDGQR